MCVLRVSAVYAPSLRFEFSSHYVSSRSVNGLLIHHHLFIGNRGEELNVFLEHNIHNISVICHPCVIVQPVVHYPGTMGLSWAQHAQTVGTIGCMNNEMRCHCKGWWLCVWCTQAPEAVGWVRLYHCNGQPWLVNKNCYQHMSESSPDGQRRGGMFIIQVY